MVSGVRERYERNVPLDSKVYEPAPASSLVHLHGIPGDPAIFTVLDGNPEVVERTKEAEVAFHLLRGNKRPRGAVCTYDIGVWPGGGVSRHRIYERKCGLKTTKLGRGVRT